MTSTVEARKASPLPRGRTVPGMVHGFVAVHTVAIFAQPVVAGRYLIGDDDMPPLHMIGADLGTPLPLEVI